MKLAEVAPAGAVTLGGTVADASELLNVTTAPFDGAGPFRYTVPLAIAPQNTEAGLMIREVGSGGLTVSVAELE